jgi:hypothetical protein
MWNKTNSRGSSDMMSWPVVVVYRALTEAEMLDESEKKERELFDEEIEEKLGQATTSEDLKVEGTNQHVPDVDDVTPEDQDNYVGADVNLPCGGVLMQAGKVKRRARDQDGELTGTSTKTTTSERKSTCRMEVRCKVEKSSDELETLMVSSLEPAIAIPYLIPDGSAAEFSANIIAEKSMFAQCEIDGNQFRLRMNLWTIKQMTQL